LYLILNHWFCTKYSKQQCFFSNNLVINIFCYIKPSLSICSNSPSLISRTAIEIIFNKSKSPLSRNNNPLIINSHQQVLQFYFSKAHWSRKTFCGYCRLHHHEPKLQYELAQSRYVLSFTFPRNHFSR
jgi:hypothetical protein